MATVDYFPKPFDFYTDQSLFLTEEPECDEYISNGAKESWTCRKYELLTPPRSPVREDESLDSSVADTLLEIVSSTLDIDTNTSQTFIFPDCSSLKSKLIQDCMWNGFNGADNAPDIKSLVADDYYDTPCSTPPPVEYNVNTDCVDPSAVFPYPVNDQHHSPLGSISSQCCSDSEEEIDVVTVEKPKRKSVPTVTPTQHIEEPAAKKLRTVPKKVNNAPSPKKAAVQTVKEVKRDSNSDVEDSESKRTVHNVLERKRRNDLKSSFQTLRHCIPELKDVDRSPKVSILKKAKEYIESLNEEELKLIALKESEKQRRKELQAKLQKLS